MSEELKAAQLDIAWMAVSQNRKGLVDYRRWNDLD